MIFIQVQRCLCHLAAVSWIVSYLVPMNSTSSCTGAAKKKHAKRPLSSACLTPGLFPSLLEWICTQALRSAPVSFLLSGQIKQGVERPPRAGSTLSSSRSALGKLAYPSTLPAQISPDGLLQAANSPLRCPVPRQKPDELHAQSPLFIHAPLGILVALSDIQTSWWHLLCFFNI